jgi:hypothetical protein
MIAVDRDIADPQFDLADRQHGGRPLHAGGERSEQVGGGDHRRGRLWHAKTRLHRRLDRQHRAGLGRLDLGPTVDQTHGPLIDGGGRPHEAAERRLGTGEHDALTVLEGRAHVLGEGRLGTALAGEDRAGDPLRRVSGRGGEAAALDQRRPGVGREVEIRPPVGLRPLPVSGGEGQALRLAPLRDLLEEGGGALLHPGLDDETGFGRVVEDRHQRRVEARHPVLLAGEGLQGDA